MGTVTLDVDRINRAFQQAVPEFKAKLDAKAAKDLHPAVMTNLLAAGQSATAKGFLGIPHTEIVDNAIGTACAEWPKINGFLNFALKLASWMPGYKAEVALAKGWLAMANQEIVPQICGLQEKK